MFYSIFLHYWVILTVMTLESLASPGQSQCKAFVFILSSLCQQGGAGHWFERHLLQDSMCADASAITGLQPAGGQRQSRLLGSSSCGAAVLNGLHLWAVQGEQDTMSIIVSLDFINSVIFLKLSALLKLSYYCAKRLGSRTCCFETKYSKYWFDFNLFSDSPLFILFDKNRQKIIFLQASFLNSLLRSPACCTVPYYDMYDIILVIHQIFLYRLFLGSSPSGYLVHWQSSCWLVFLVAR